MNEIQEILGPDGVIARRLQEYEERPEQLQLAEAAAESLARGGHLLAEAGTGVGKSFAYLLPAVLHACEHTGGPVVISTRTIALQQQLETKDLPFLRAVLPLEWSAVTAVGRNNYLCLRRTLMMKKLLKEFGVDDERLRLEWISASEGEKYSRVSWELENKIRELGPLELQQ